MILVQKFKAMNILKKATRFEKKSSNIFDIYWSSQNIWTFKVTKIQGVIQFLSFTQKMEPIYSKVCIMRPRRPRLLEF